MTFLLEAKDREVISTFCQQLNASFQEDEGSALIDNTFTLSPPTHPENEVPGKWNVFLATVIPGVYRTANGDGWPDDVDVSLLGAFDTLREALIKIGHNMIEHLVQHAEEAALGPEDFGA